MSDKNNVNEQEMKDLLARLDKEQSFREHQCWRRHITVIVSVVFCIFQLYATLSGTVTAQILRATHLAFVQFLAFLLFPATKKHPKNTLPWYDWVLGLTGATHASTEATAHSFLKAVLTACYCSIFNCLEHWHWTAGKEI